MRVLQVNKFLYGGAGAETVMLRTAELLAAHGHEVSFFAMQDPRNQPCAESVHFAPARHYGVEHSRSRRARDAAASIYSLSARRALRGLLRERRPDVAHLHNVYHQLTLSVVDELAAQGVPMVMTLHDYKPVCPSYVLYTGGAVCHRCVGSHPLHAVAHRCIKGSRAASTLAAAEAMLVRARSSYRRIDAFICPSRHIAEVMIEGGLPAERMHVIPNFVADEQLREGSPSASPKPPMVLFVGRLETVKGIQVLLAAAREIAPEVEVVIVGQGPLENEVQAAQSEGAVRYLGRRDWREIAELMDSARAVVVPSIWEENCPMVVLEAGARGCPVIASRRGGLVELVDDGEDGILFTPGDSQALAAAMQLVARDDSLSSRLGSARYARTLAENTAAVHLSALMETYLRAAGEPGAVPGEDVRGPAARVDDHR